MSERMRTAPTLERGDEADVDPNNVIDAEIVEESTENQGSPEASASTTESPAPETNPPGAELVPYVEIQPLPPADEPRQITGSEPTRLTFATVDQSADVFNAARDEADRRLDRELAGKGIIKKIWKGNFLKEYYRNKYTQEAKREIEALNDINLYETGDKTARAAAQLATIDRMTSEYEESLHESVGERRNEMDETLANEIRNLIRRNVSPSTPEEKLDDAALQNEVRRLSDRYAEANKGQGNGVLGEGLVRINNSLEIAQAVKGAIEHGESIDTVLANMRFVTAEAYSGVRTEAQHTKLDSLNSKIMEKMAKRGLTAALVSPEVIVAATSLAYSVGKWGTNSVLGNIAKFVPVVGAGLLSGARESVRVTNERAQHTREMAQGKQFDKVDASKLGFVKRNLYKLSGGNRREQMEKARYETKSATSLVDMLDGNIYGTEADLSSDEAVKAALMALAEVESRIRTTDSPNKKDRVDLISYSSSTNIEEERLALDIARAQAKTTLNARLDLATRKALELDENASITELLDRPIEVANMAIERDMSDKDAAFRKLKAKRVATSAAMGIAGGLLIGGLIQEGVASFRPDKAGLIEELWNANNHTTDGSAVHETIYKSFSEGDLMPFNGGSVLHHEPSGNYHDILVGDKNNGSVSVSDDLAWEKATDGSYTVKGHDGAVLADHIVVQSDGHITPESIDTLKRTADIDFQDNTYTQSSQEVPVASHVKGSLKDYMASDKKGQVNKFHIDSHENNKTKLIDKNERKVLWGGVNGTGVKDNGGYQLDISKMTANGSFNNKGSVDVLKEAAAGNLKVAIQPDGRNADAVFVDVTPDGKIDIDPDSKAAAFFSKDAKGHAVYHGKYLEPFRVNGVNPDGSMHGDVVATVVGDGTAVNGTYDIETQVKPVVQEVPSYRINSLGYDTPTEVDVPVVPVVPRRSLETVQTPTTGETRRRSPTPEVPSGDGGDTFDLDNMRRQIGALRTERVLERGGGERRRITTSRRAIESASRDTTRPSGAGSYRLRDLGREPIGSVAARERRNETRGGRTRPKPISAALPSGDSTGPNVQVLEKAKVMADALKRAGRLSNELNAGKMTETQVADEADRLFGRSGWQMVPTSDDNFLINVRPEGFVAFQRRTKNRGRPRPKNTKSRKSRP